MEKKSLAITHISSIANYRATINENIQSYSAKECFFHAPLYHPKANFVSWADFHAFTYNAFDKFQRYGVRRA